MPIGRRHFASCSWVLPILTSALDWRQIALRQALDGYSLHALATLARGRFNATPRPEAIS